MPPQTVCRTLARRCISSIPPERIVQSPHEPLPLPLPTADLYTFVRTEGKWDEVADRTALRCSQNEFRAITYRELDGRIKAAAHQLTSMGFQRGDVLNIHLHNCQQFVVAFFATAALGGCATTSNPAYVAHELAMQHKDSGARFVLSSRDYEEVVAAAAAESGLSGRVSWVEDAECFANAPPVDGLTAPTPEPPVNGAEDTLALPYSSGTTGLPKGVMLSHQNLACNAMQNVIADRAAGVRRDDTLIGVLPLFHIYGMTVLMAYPMLMGAQVVLMHRFEPTAFLDAMATFKVGGVALRRCPCCALSRCPSCALMVSPWGSRRVRHECAWMRLFAHL